MKRSELKEFIKGEIFSSLSEASMEDVNNQKELNKELEKTSKLSKEMGLEEANIGLADLEETGYEDGEKSVAMHFNQDVIGINSRPDFFAYRKGFVQAVVDSTKSYEINEDIDDTKDDIKDTLSKMKVSELKAKIKEQILAELSLSEVEEEVDVNIDVEDEVDVDVEADDIEIEKPATKVKVEVGLSPEEELIQDSLKAAMDSANALGNDKLADQIGNTITFFTREYVVGNR